MVIVGTGIKGDIDMFYYNPYEDCYECFAADGSHYNYPRDVYVSNYEDNYITQEAEDAWEAMNEAQKYDV